MVLSEGHPPDAEEVLPGHREIPEGLLQGGLLGFTVGHAGIVDGGANLVIEWGGNGDTTVTLSKS